MEILRGLRHHSAFFLFVGTLFAFSIVFTWRVEVMRASVAKARGAEDLPSGTDVEVIQVVDGDELAVRSPGGKNFVVRVLGIKSFDAVAREQGVSSFGQASVDFLKDRTSAKTVRLEFTTYAKDSRGRLLSYVHVGEEDLGKSLVERGLSLVFVQYPFDRESEYLVQQSLAQASKIGLWGNDKARARASALLASWKAARK